MSKVVKEDGHVEAPEHQGDNKTQGELMKIHPASDGDRARVVDFAVSNGCTVHDEGHDSKCVCIELGDETTREEFLQGMKEEHINFTLNPTAEDCEKPVVKQESFSLLRDLLTL